MFKLVKKIWNKLFGWRTYSQGVYIDKNGKTFCKINGKRTDLTPEEAQRLRDSVDKAFDKVDKAFNTHMKKAFDELGDALNDIDFPKGEK